MLKLSKYELRKNRNALLLLLAGLALLQVIFLITLPLKNDSYVMSSVGTLTLYGVVCYFSIFIFAITNYYREINSRTSYLIFMTPVSPLRIILSKMLTVLLLGMIIAGVLSAIAIIDLQLLTTHYEQYTALADLINDALRQFGINTGEILFNLLFGLVTFLLSFYSTVTLLYLCITLSATLLQNSRFKLIVSIILFLVITFLRSKLEEWIRIQFPVQVNETLTRRQFPAQANEAAIVGNLLYQALPYTLLNLAIILISITATTWLLKKKLSL